MLDLT